MKKKNKRDFLELTDLKLSEFEEIFKLTEALKKKPHRDTLKNKTVGLIFTKSSERKTV